MNKLNRHFIGSCEAAFEPNFEKEQDAKYYGMVERPEYERQEVEAWERSLDYSSQILCHEKQKKKE